MSSLELHHFLTLSTLWYKMRAEEEGNIRIFDTRAKKKRIITKATACPTGKIANFRTVI